MVTNTKFLKLPEVRARTGKSRSSIYQGVNDGTFPRQIKLGPRAVAWSSIEIDAWIQSCIDGSRSGDSE